MEQQPRFFVWREGADRSIRGAAPKSRSAAGRLRSRPAKGMFRRQRWNDWAGDDMTGA